MDPSRFLFFFGWGDVMATDREDFPVISPPSDTTKVSPVRPVEEKKPAPEPRKPVPAAADPQRPPTETRRAVTPAPRPAPPPSSAPAARDEDDPERLLREYSDRQKNKIARLEQELHKAQAERDGYKARSETISKELLEAKKQLEGMAKQEEMIRDLQQKLDAALLSNGMVQSENAKLKVRASDLEANLQKTEERASRAEKTASETQASLGQQTQARQEAEAKIAAALQALQARSAPPKK